MIPPMGSMDAMRWTPMATDEPLSACPGPPAFRSSRGISVIARRLPGPGRPRGGGAFGSEFADWLKLAAWLADNAIKTPLNRWYTEPAWQTSVVGNAFAVKAYEKNHPRDHGAESNVFLRNDLYWMVKSATALKCPPFGRYSSSG